MRTESTSPRELITTPVASRPRAGWAFPSRVLERDHRIAGTNHPRGHLPLKLFQSREQGQFGAVFLDIVSCRG